MSYELHVDKGESYEDALHDDIRYFLEKTDHIGCFTLHLSENAQGVVDLMKTYLKEVSPNKVCTECNGSRRHGVSIDGTGSVELVTCHGCQGAGRIPKHMDQPKPMSDKYYGDMGVKKFYGHE